MRPDVALLILSALVLGQSASAQSQYQAMSAGMGITQKLGDAIPKDVPFLDEQGRTVTLNSYLGKEPVLVLPIFYSCQTGCAMITDGLVQTLLRASQPTMMMGMVARNKADRPLTPGKDLEIVMLSINPTETPTLAANKKNEILNSVDDRGKSTVAKLLYGPGAHLAEHLQDHLHLLTGSYPNIKKVTDAIGFTYYYNPRTAVIKHPTGSVLLTPDGRISSYTIGNDFPTHMLEAGLVVASRNQISNHRADQSFMFGCVMLDPSTGHIRFVVENLVRLGCVLTLLIFGTSVFVMLKNEHKQRKTPQGGFAA